MKAILVINIDDDMAGEVDYTVLSKSEMVNGRTKLRPLPEPKDLGYPNDDYDIGFADGWDACLREITGETK